MATLSVQDVVLGGVEPSLSAASSGGDDCPNDGRTFLYVENTDTASHDVSPNADKPGRFGKDVDPDPVTIPAGSWKLLGPFDRDIFGSNLDWTYSSTTGMSVAALRLTSVLPR